MIQIHWNETVLPSLIISFSTNCFHFSLITMSELADIMADWKSAKNTYRLYLWWFPNQIVISPSKFVVRWLEQKLKGKLLYTAAPAISVALIADTWVHPWIQLWQWFRSAIVSCPEAFRTWRLVVNFHKCPKKSHLRWVNIGNIWRSVSWGWWILPLFNFFFKIFFCF